MFIVNWYNPCSSGGLCMNFDYDISGLFIVIVQLYVHLLSYMG